MKRKLLLLGLIVSICCVGCSKKTSDKGKTYTKDQILEKCGLEGINEYSEDGNTAYYQTYDDEKYGYTYLGIRYEDSEYRGWRFYIYDSENKAKKELRRQKKERFIDDEDFEAGSNYVMGWEAGVCDASIKSFSYQTGNIIIEYEDECIGEMYSSEEDWQDWHDSYYSPEAVKARDEENKKIHEKIMSEFN